MTQEAEPIVGPWIWVYRVGLITCQVALFACVLWVKLNFVSVEEYKHDREAMDAQRELILNGQNNILIQLAGLNQKMANQAQIYDELLDHEHRIRDLEKMEYRGK